jgi:hypothetical protein
VAADPDVLLLVAHEVGERGDHGLAVAHQDLAGARFQPAVAEQRDERRDEDEVGRAGRLHAFHRLVRHVGRRIVEQRDQQRTEAGVVDMTDGGGHVPPAVAGRVARISCDLDQGRLCGVHVRGRRAGRECHGRGHADARIGIGEQRPRQCRRILVVDRANRDDRGGPDPGIRIPQHAPHLREPPHADVAAHGAERAQRAPPHHR